MTIAEARGGSGCGRCPWAQSHAITTSPPTCCSRNLDAGRANKPAYIDARGTHTYGQLADRVARFGAALRGLGIRREERVLMALLDTVDWPTAFLGCLKAGIVAVPVNTLLTEDDYRFMLADSRAKCLVVSEALFPKFEKLIARSPDLDHVIVSGEQSARLPAVRGPDRRRRAGRLHRADHRRRHRVLALHLGLDRQAERRGACARQPEADRRSLRHADRRHEGKRRLLFGGETVFRLRARQRHDLSAHRSAPPRCSMPSGRRRTASRRCCASIRSRCSSRCRPSMPRFSTARTRRKNRK